MNRSVLFILLAVLATEGFAELDWKKRLAESESRLAAAQTIEARFEVLPGAAHEALQVGDFDKAVAYGTEALELAESFKASWNYGNAIHRGHLLLGEVALQKGDVTGAGKELLLAAETPGSPQLDSFGPSMALAKKLLELGQKEIVLEYLQKCREFWKMDYDRLEQWSTEIKSGKTPAFEPNIAY